MTGDREQRIGDREQKIGDREQGTGDRNASSLSPVTRHLSPSAYTITLRIGRPYRVSQGLDNDRDRMLFGVCLFSACRIRECVTLLTGDVYTPKGEVRPLFVIRKSNTKGKLATRSIPVIEDLRRLLSDHYRLAGYDYLFPVNRNIGY